jgi:hypothetical protein
MIVGQPLEKGARLLDLGARQRNARRQQLARDLSRPRAHAGPVGDGDAHIAENLEYPPPDLGELLAAADPVDLDVLPGLQDRLRVCVVVDDLLDAPAPIATHAQHGMNHEVDRDAAGVQHHRQRIDEKRHVVGHDFDDRSLAGPAVCVCVRLEHAHQ